LCNKIIAKYVVPKINILQLLLLLDKIGRWLVARGISDDWRLRVN